MGLWKFTVSVNLNAFSNDKSYQNAVCTLRHIRVLDFIGIREKLVKIFTNRLHCVI